jgi:hypothetical protein
MFFVVAFMMIPKLASDCDSSRVGYRIFRVRRDPFRGDARRSQILPGEAALSAEGHIDHGPTDWQRNGRAEDVIWVVVLLGRGWQVSCVPGGAS